METKAIASSPPQGMLPAQIHLGRTILSALLVSLTLGVLSTVLTLPGGIGPDEFLSLGSIDTTLMDRVATTWQHLVIAGSVHTGPKLTLAAVAFFAIDTALFVALYSWLVFELIRRAAQSPEITRSRVARVAAYLLTYATAALVAVDLAENASGLMALSAAEHLLNTFIGLVALAAAVAFWRLRLNGSALLEQIGSVSPTWARTARIAHSIMMIGLIVSAAILALGLIKPRSTALQIAAGYIHAAKNGLLLAVGVGVVVRGIQWLFGEAHDSVVRAQVRRGLGDLLIRVRYVLLTLGMLIVFTLILNQSRDVVLSVADGFRAGGPWLLATVVLGLAVLAIWALAFSCWFWTRVICRLRSPKDPPTQADEASRILQMAAKQTARALGLAPLIVVAMLSATAARDAIWAAHGRAAANPDLDFQVSSPWILLLFGVLSLCGARLFLTMRERASRDAQAQTNGYWNDLEPDRWIEQLEPRKYRFLVAHGPDALTLPILAFTSAVVIRAIVTFTTPGVSFALVVIVASLVGWLGLFGWLSIKERREARPWVLAILAVVGLLGIIGVTDNHEIRVIRHGISGALPHVSTQIIGSLLLATWVVLGSWLILRNAGRSRPQRTMRFVWTVVGLVALASGITLWRIDTYSRTHSSATLQEPAPRRTLDEAFETWTAQLRENYPAPGQRVFFVTSEGGGIRAAYWTARALQELQTHRRDFNARTFMLSGVSGGALGEAIYVACARDPNPSTCLTRFGERDLLTPMVGAWLFEDGLARILPTSAPRELRKHFYCTQPGCGFLSRGLWFEQGLEQALPQLRGSIAALDDPSDSHRAHLPHLFLNSTSVESGDRAIASDLQVKWQNQFPDARDQITDSAAQGPGTGLVGAPTDLPLSTAAHNASRFPYFNAIGVLRDATGHASHLADGGYFDNSGGQTTADVLASFRAWIEHETRQPCQQHAGDDCGLRKSWLAALQPTLIAIQNGIEADCPTFWPLDKRVECIEPLWPASTTILARAYEPAKPRDSAAFRLFVDALGPIATVVNVSGIRANGRRAAGLLERACAWHPDGKPCVLQLAQREDGSLYPLGWYLSASARAAIDQQAIAEIGVLLPQLE